MLMNIRAHAFYYEIKHLENIMPKECNVFTDEF